MKSASIKIIPLFWAASFILFAHTALGDIRPTKFERVPLQLSHGDPIWELTAAVAMEISGYKLLNFPTGLDVKNIKNTDLSLVVVADAGWCQIVSIRTEWIYPDERMIHNISCYGKWGKTTDAFRFPFGAAIGGYNGEFDPSNDYIFVTDTGNRRIVRLRYDYNHNRLLWDMSFGADHLKHPQGIVYYDKGTESNADDEILIADSDRAAIVRFNVSGNYLGTYGEYGSHYGQFLSPIGICKGPNGSIWEDYFYITDPYNYKICCYEFSHNQLVLVNEIDFSNEEIKSEFMGIASDFAGWVYAADWNKNRIVKFSPELGFAAIINSSCGYDFSLNKPIGLCYYDSTLTVLNDYSIQSGILTYIIKYADELIWDEDWNGGNGEGGNGLIIDLYSDFRIPCGRILRIGKGIQIRMQPNIDYHNIGIDPNRIEIIAEGSISCFGDDPDSVWFLSAGIPPLVSDWYGIRVLEPCGTVNMEYTAVRHAEKAVEFYDNVMNSTLLTGSFNNSRFDHTNIAGIYSYRGVLNIKYCAFENNKIYGFCGLKSDADLYNSSFLRNQRYGIWIDGISNPPDSVRIINSTIDGENGSTTIDGLYLSHPQARVEGCRIKNYNSTAIRLQQNNRPLLKYDTLNCIIGIDCSANSSPKVRSCSISHEKLKVGVNANKGCFPHLGDIYDPGKNSIILGGFTGYYVANYNISAISAQLNWWGIAPPYLWGFYGNVNYQPYLEEEPHGLKPISEYINDMPLEFSIFQNFPNPFNDMTRISYDIPVNGFVNISIYNVLGQKIKELINEEVAAGNHNISWDATNEEGARVSSGLFFVKIKYMDNEQTKKIILLR